MFKKNNFVARTFTIDSGKFSQIYFGDRLIK